ncbi:MAG: DUF364 domain-containing protein [Burkholderiaceae bacterium]|nr:DUF364 domain-containing protein [Burkholderiaceae bacterium]
MADRHESRDAGSREGRRAFAHELLGRIEAIAALGPLPAVARVHLPLAADEGSRESEFCGVELDDGSIGLSFLLLGDTFARLRSDSPAQALRGMPALELARGYLDDDPVRRTLGFAAVNAISQRFFREAGQALDTAADSIGSLDPQPGERIGMVGLFGPLVPRIVGAGASLVVLELQSRLAGEHDGWRVTLDPVELADCEKVLCTTTVLLNDTLDAVLDAVRGARWIAFVGPGGGCVPDDLFARGVTLLGGTAIVDRDGFADAVSRGQPWGRYARKYVIARDRYPGFDRLCAKIARAP